MERKGADDWDNQKLQRLAKEYMAMRKEIWQGLAARTGEKWNVVEQKVRSPPTTISSPVADIQPPFAVYVKWFKEPSKRSPCRSAP